MCTLHNSREGGGHKAGYGTQFVLHASIELTNGKESVNNSYFEGQVSRVGHTSKCLISRVGHISQG